MVMPVPTPIAYTSVKIMGIYAVRKTAVAASVTDRDWRVKRLRASCRTWTPRPRTPGKL
jgi:hypothetical protein